MHHLSYHHRNPDFADLLSPAYLQDPAHCPAVGPHGRRLLLAEGEAVKPTFFFAAAGLCTGASVGGGALLALLALFLFKKSPEGMVNASAALQVGRAAGGDILRGSLLELIAAAALLAPPLPETHTSHTPNATTSLTPPETQVAIPAAIAVAALLSGSPGAAAPFALMAGVLGFTLYLYRDQLQLVARLLGISVRALSDLPGIAAAALGLSLLGAWGARALFGGAVFVWEVQGWLTER
jgi:hypothetical protein